jgi:hypothetical protein
MTIGVAVCRPARWRHCDPDNPSRAVVPSFAGGSYDSYDLNAAPARKPQTRSAPDFTRIASGDFERVIVGIVCQRLSAQRMDEGKRLVRLVLVAQNLSTRTAHPDATT